MPKAVAMDIEGSLRRRIESGEWAGGRLPPERELASEYGVARNTVRKAIEAIAGDGRVVRQIGRGTFLAAEAGEFTDIMNRVTGVSPADLMAVRMIVEPHAAAVAATTASSADLDLIAEAHDRAAAEQSTDHFEQLDALFHQRIFAAARNELMMSLHDILRMIRNRNAWIELKRKTFTENRRLDYCRHHGEILAALQNRDADGAAAAMKHHMVVIEGNLFGRR